MTVLSSSSPLSPSSVEEAAAEVVRTGGELRAAGTDTTARRNVGRAATPFVDLRGLTALRGISREAGGGIRIGASATVAEVAADPDVAGDCPALAAAAGALATPQIRNTATVGGNLLQRNRCWYYRNPHFSCHQSGGDTCPARSGDYPYAAVVGQAPCVAPHPSSLAVALLAHDATAEVHGRGAVPVADLYGDGSDPGRDHLLDPGEVLLSVGLPEPQPGERSGHQRTTARDDGEWPLVEAVARLVVTGGTITYAAVAVGGVARTPLRLAGVEDALMGREAVQDTLTAAAARTESLGAPRAAGGARAALLAPTVLEVLERALRNGA